jgi:hypothetical protein
MKRERIKDSLRETKKLVTRLNREMREGPDRLSAMLINRSLSALLGNQLLILEILDRWLAEEQALKADVAMVEVTKTEVPEATHVKAEGAKTEVPKAKVPKTEVPKAKVPKTEVPKAEGAKTEVPKTEVPKAKVPKTEDPKAEGAKTEVPKAEGAKTEVPKAEAATAAEATAAEASGKPGAGAQERGETPGAPETGRPGLATPEENAQALDAFEPDAIARWLQSGTVFQIRGERAYLNMNAMSRENIEEIIANIRKMGFLREIGLLQNDGIPGDVLVFRR